MSAIVSKVKLPYLLLLPGFLFLFTFFILPIANLAQTSTQTPIAGGDTGQYEQTCDSQTTSMLLLKIKNSLRDPLSMRFAQQFWH